MFGHLSGLGQRVSQFMCLKEEPEMNALLHVPTSCLDDMTTSHGLQPREVCLSSDFVFSCEQNWQFKDDGKGHTLKDIKWVLQALCTIQNILVLMPLYNQQKVKNNKDKQCFPLSLLNIIQITGLASFFPTVLISCSGLVQTQHKNALVNLVPFFPP